MPRSADCGSHNGKVLVTFFSQKPVGLSNHSFGTVFRNILGILNTLCFQLLCDLIIQLVAHQNQVSVFLTLAENFSKSQVLGYSKVQGHT